MKFTKSTWAAIGASLLLAACGGGGGGSAAIQNSSTARGTLIQSPPVRTVSLTAADFSSELQANGSAGQLLLSLATAGTGSSTLSCGVDVQYIKYVTVGGNGEATQASAALMVPTGGSGCSGPRPIVLHAHGTAVERRYNLADFIDATNPAHDEQTLIASQFAAKGYIVVAPNYAGYDSSPLTYHPFLVADQQSKDMMDALAAARAALPALIAPVSDNGKLFISGISQGGYVAIATFKAMRQLNMAVNGIAPIEPVSQLLNYGDQIMSGGVPVGSTYLIPMLVNGYQKTYGTLYSTPSEYYEPAYAGGVEAAFPGAFTSTTLVTTGKVPQAHLFSGGAAVSPAPFASLFAGGVGTGNLITDAARSAYLNNPSTNPLRVKLQLNDLGALTVDKPMMLCGGSSDPTVFFSTNAETTAAALATNPYVSILDLENSYPLLTITSSTATRVTGAAATQLQGGFSQAKAHTQAADPNNQLAVVTAYHGTLVPPFCVAAASGYFANF
jgi:hypothetical protein